MNAVRCYAVYWNGTERHLLESLLRERRRVIRSGERTHRMIMLELAKDLTLTWDNLTSVNDG